MNVAANQSLTLEAFEAALGVANVRAQERSRLSRILMVRANQPQSKQNAAPQNR